MSHRDTCRIPLGEILTFIFFSKAMKRSREGPNRASTIPRIGVIDTGGGTERFLHKYLGWNKTYDTEFEPVSLWSRGVNKMEWIRQTDAWISEDTSFQEVMRITWLGWIFKVFLPALSLIAIPPAAGGVVAFFTPPRGIGCRSLSFILYAGCQGFVTAIALVRNAGDGRESGVLKWLSTGWRFQLISWPFWFGSLLAAVGGTVMQISGVYNNCICYANAPSWWNIKELNPPIQVASDTQAARTSSSFWIGMGITATAFMALNCYIGWWYQRLIRHRYIAAVENMYKSPAMERNIASPVISASRSGDSMDEPLLRGAAWPEDPRSSIAGSSVTEAIGSSAVRSFSPQSRGSTTSSLLPAIWVSGDTGVEEHELLSPRKPRPRADS